MAEFTPIETQEQLDAIIAKRLKDQKDQTEEVANLKAQLESKDKEISEIKKTHAVDWELAKRGLDAPVTAAKVESIKKLIDLDSETDPAEQIESLSKQVPELFQVPQGSGGRATSGFGVGWNKGQHTPFGADKEKPLTEEDIQKMTPEEMAKPGIMERIDKFMAGQR